MKKMNKIKKPVIAAMITIIVFAAVAGLHLLGVFNFLEFKSYDMRVKFWADRMNASKPSDEILLIYLDQDSIDWAQKEKEWGWPWPRQAYAEIVSYMNMNGANSLAFDVLFSEPSIYRNAAQDKLINDAISSLESAEAGSSVRSALRNAINTVLKLKDRVDDASFINASEEFGHVVQTVMFSSQTGSALTWPSGLNVPLFQPENFGDMLNKFSIGENEKAQFPIQGLREAAGALGSVTGIPDSDGIIRRLRPFTLFDGKAIPGLSSASLLVNGKERKINYNKKKNLIEWEGVSIPIDKNGNALLRYKGDLQAKYRPLRAMDVMLSYESYLRGEDLEFGVHVTEMGTEWNMIPLGFFTGAYVFVGYNAQGLFDIFSTPISSVYPGVGCHVTMLDNILQGEFIRESAERINLLILFAVVVLIVSFSMFSHRITISVGGMITAVLAVIIGAFLSYHFGGLWIPMITFLAGIIGSFITVTLYNYATEGSQKRFIKSAFSQYLSPKVVDQLILDPSQLKLGGEKREMTAIFTDIRAFSTFSEALGDPAKLVELLNFYLTRMSNIVLENQGTIDKYEGDAIIAFFGAPIHFENHASLACRAAIQMKKAEAELNREALSLGLITPGVMEAMTKKGILSGIDDPNPIFTRLGINTGDMVVGNMGTPNKMDYTIMGNAVNLAARLEGVNKQYDTGGILISEYTRAKISGQGSGDEFIIRPLSRVRVVGINTPLRLYEPLDTAENAPPELLNMVKNWQQAFDFYEKKDFLAAKNIFQTICSKNEKDMAAKKYLNRCIKYINSPPDDNTWDNGVDNLTEK